MPRIAEAFDLKWWLSGSAPPATTLHAQPTTTYQPVLQPSPIADWGAWRATLNAVKFPQVPQQTPPLRFTLPATPYRPLDLTLLSGLPSPTAPEPITVSGGGLGSWFKAAKTVFQAAKPIVKNVSPWLRAASGAQDVYNFGKWLIAHRDPHPPAPLPPIGPYNPAYPPTPGQPF